MMQSAPDLEKGILERCYPLRTMPYTGDEITTFNQTVSALALVIRRSACAAVQIVTRFVSQDKLQPPPPPGSFNDSFPFFSTRVTFILPHLSIANRIKHPAHASACCKIEQFLYVQMAFGPAVHCKIVCCRRQNESRIDAVVAPATKTNRGAWLRWQGAKPAVQA